MELDQILVDMGAELREGFTVEELTGDDDTVTGIRGTIGNGRDLDGAELYPRDYRFIY